VVNTAHARAMQNGFLNTQKRRKRPFHAVTSILRVHCVGAQGLGSREGGGSVLLVAVCGTPSCRSLWLPRDMAVKEEFLKVENATSAFPATCLLLIATALGQVWRCRADAHL